MQKKHGYDVKVFPEFLSEPKHPDCFSFQRCLIPSQLMDYDCVIMLDADIYIHDNAPPLHLLATDKIRIVNEVAQITPEQYRSIDWLSQPIEYHSLAGFHLQTDMILNGGVMVCKPALHAEFLKNRPVIPCGIRRNKIIASVSMAISPTTGMKAKEAIWFTAPKSTELDTVPVIMAAPPVMTVMKDLAIYALPTEGSKPVSGANTPPASPDKAAPTVKVHI